MLRNLVALIIFASLPAFAQIWPEDVIVLRDTSVTTFATPSEQSDLAACHDRIPSLMCLVDPAKNERDENQGARACLEGSERYAVHFQGHFDRSPDLIKKMYCHLSRIWVEKSFRATAYATPITDEKGQMVGGGIGIRQEILDSPQPFDEWITWKEETSFGGSLKSTDPHLGILQYRSSPNSAEFLLDYVMNHEFGHLFDFANQLNRLSQCEYKEVSPGHWEVVGDCKPLPGSWGELSWETVNKPKTTSNFEYRSDICFYSCRGKFIRPELAPTIFRSMLRTDFPSTYASKHPAEDWAEAFALYLAHSHSNFRLSLSLSDEVADLSSHFQGPLMEQKRVYVRRFIESRMLYPGQK